MQRPGSIQREQHNVLVLADDVSGAAEAAAAFIGRTSGLEVHLHGGLPNGQVTVVDLHTRRVLAIEAEKAVAQSLSGAEGMRVVIKIDSLLRGHIQATVRAATATGRPVVIAAGNPALGRTVVGGVVLVDGTPLADTGLWGAESTAPPSSVADVVGHAPGVRIVDIDSDADPTASLRRRLRRQS